MQPCRPSVMIMTGTGKSNRIGYSSHRLGLMYDVNPEISPVHEITTKGELNKERDHVMVYLTKGGKPLTTKEYHNYRKYYNSFTLKLKHYNF